MLLPRRKVVVIPQSRLSWKKWPFYAGHYDHGDDNCDMIIPQQALVHTLDAHIGMVEGGDSERTTLITWPLASEQTLICHTTMHRNAINVLNIPGHVTLWCLEVVPVVYASNVIPQKNMSELA